MFCPKCHVNSLEVHPVIGQGFELEQCTKCQGLWFDAGELETALAELAEQDLEIPADTKTLPVQCPKCRRLLKTFNYPGTYAKIEMCGNCRGFWLDAEEWDEIVRVREYRKTHPQEPCEIAEDEDDDKTRSVKKRLLDMINRTIESMTS